jgi:hypothetical protein
VRTMQFRYKPTFGTTAPGEGGGVGSRQRWIASEIALGLMQLCALDYMQGKPVGELNSARDVWPLSIEQSRESRETTRRHTLPEHKRPRGSLE